MSQYVHLTELDDPAKPHRRVWRCEATGVYVKTHAIKMAEKFGRVGWKITGSLCDENGKALKDENEQPLVHARPHQFIAMPSNDPNATAEQQAAQLATDFDAALKYVVARVERAALVRAAAAAL